MSDSQSMAIRDPETAAILRRQALIAALNKPMDQTAYRSAASPWVAGLQAVANGVNAYMGDRDLRDLGERRGSEAQAFMANALAGLMPGQGGGQAAAPGAAPVAAATPPSRGSYTDRMVAMESNGDPNARNPLSSATGAGQFIDGTWLQFAQANPDRFQGMSRDQILAARNDPNLSREAVDWYRRENLAALEGQGLPANDGTAALAHRFGPQGAAGLLRADPNAPIDGIVGPQVMAANPDLAGRSVGQVVGNYAQRFGGSQPSPSGSAPPATPAAPQPAGLNRQAIVIQAMQGLQSTNPMVRERAAQLLQMAQALPQAPQRTFSTAAPGSYITDNAGNITGRVPDAPDNTLETIADPTSPTGYRRVPRAAAANQPVAAPGPQVAIDQRGQSAYDQHRGTALATEEADIRAAGPRARQTIGRLGVIEQNLDRFRSGAMAGMQMRVGQIANAIGVPPSVLERMGMSTDTVAAGEQIGSVSAQMLQGMLGPGGFPAQGFSNADREMLERALPGLANTPQGNRLIIGVMRAQAQRQIDISEAWGQWRRQNGAGMESYDRFTMERLPQITGQDVLVPLLQDAFPAETTPTAAPGIQADPPAAPPRAGEVRRGYRFRGGNPADQSSWEPVR